MSSETPHVLDLVEPLIHDLLSPAEAEEVERHCAACADCRNAVEMAKNQLVGFQAALTPVRAPSLLLVKTMQNIMNAKRRSVWFQRYFLSVAAVTAVAVIAIYGWFFYFDVQKENSIDLTIFAQSEYMAESEASFRIQLTTDPPESRSHRVPMPGIPVTALLRHHGSQGMTAILGHVNTDEFGMGQFHFTLPDWEGEFELRIIAKTPGGDEILKSPVTLKRAAKIILTSDKPVYQPGQQILLRAIGLKQPDRRPLANHPATFTLIDHRGTVLFSMVSETNKFGIATGNIPLRPDLAEDSYVVFCRIGSDETLLAIDLKNATVPRFKIEITPDKPYYTLGSMAKIKVAVHKPNGDPVKNAEVRLTKTVDRSPPIVSMPIKTNADGIAQFEESIELNKIPLNRIQIRRFGDPPPGPHADDPHVQSRAGIEYRSLDFIATVTDETGSKDSTQFYSILTSSAVRIDIWSEAGPVLPDMPTRIYILVREPNGIPIVGVNLGVYLGVVDGSQRLITDHLVTDRNGLASFLAPTDVFSFRASVLDDHNQEIASRRTSFSRQTHPKALLMRSNKSVYSSDETVKLTALGSDGPVFVDLIRQDAKPQIISCTSFEIIGGRGEAEIRIPKGVAGTVRLWAYRTNTPGPVASVSRVIYILPHEDLKVAARLLTPEQDLQAGKIASLQFGLTDAAGKPITGVLSLLGIRESMNPMFSPFSRLEKLSYPLDNRWLRPVYELSSWEPGWKADQPAEVREELERALFSTMASWESGGLETIAPATRPMPDPHSLNLGTWKAKREKHIHYLDLSSDRFRITVFVVSVSVMMAIYIGIWLMIRSSAIRMIFLYCLIPYLYLIVFSALYVLFLYPLGADTVSELRKRENRVHAEIDAIRKRGGMAQIDLRKQKIEPEEIVSSPFYDPPEPLLWRPLVITDEQGRYTVSISLSEAATTCRLTAFALTMDGRFGSTEVSIPVRPK